MNYALAHFRPHILPPLASLRGRKINAPAVNAPHAQTQSGLAIGIVRLGYAWFDYMLWFMCRCLHHENSLVLFDRHFTDQLIDPRRYKLANLPRWLIALFANSLPRPDLVVALVGDSKQIWLRKREISEQEIEAQNTRLRDTAANGRRVLVVDTTLEPLELSLERVAEAVFATLRGR